MPRDALVPGEALFLDLEDIQRRVQDLRERHRHTLAPSIVDAAMSDLAGEVTRARGVVFDAYDLDREGWTRPGDGS